jgi:hypothetical protein
MITSARHILKNRPIQLAFLLLGLGFLVIFGILGLGRRDSLGSQWDIMFSASARSPTLVCAWFDKLKPKVSSCETLELGGMSQRSSLAIPLRHEWFGWDR